MADAAAEALADARHRTRARQVYVPLGVGGHIDHRLAHDAALRAFDSGDGRNVFLYEERPEAFVRGAVRMRLGQVGARLPPGAAEAADDTEPGRVPPALPRPPSLRGRPEGLGGARAGGAGGRAALARGPVVAARERGSAPGSSPSLHETPDASLAAVRAMAAEAAASPRAAERMSSLATRYARRLGARGHAERLWLLLPPAAHGRLTPVGARGRRGRGGLLSRRHAGSGSASSAFHRSGSWSQSVLRYVRICSPV